MTMLPPGSPRLGKLIRPVPRDTRFSSRCANRPRPASAGFSLVELMIAMTIGLVLLSGMIAVFSGNRQSAELNTALASMQENARYAMDKITRDARLAGHQGCADISSAKANIRATNAPTADYFLTSIYGATVTTPADWNPAPPPTFVYNNMYPAIAGTHALVIQYGSTDTPYLVNDMSAPSDDIVIRGNAGPWLVDNGSLLLVSNCAVADLFRASSVTLDAAGNTQITHTPIDNQNNANVSLAYEGVASLAPLQLKKGTAQVMEFHSNVYYIGDTGIRTEAGSPVTSLYMQSLPYAADNPPIELIQGVENLRLQFGLRTVAGTLSYVTPGDPDFDPARIESLQVGLLMTSWDPIASMEDNSTYFLAGQAIPAGDNGAPSGLTHATDRRFRLPFNTTVQVRNRRPDASP